MEIIKPTFQEEEVDEMARKVFMEAIKLVGGLRKVVEFKNLTWVPSLAAASYAVILKNEFFLSNFEIAKQLGMSKESIERMLSADTSEIKKFLAGEVEKIDEHKAGGLAKLAYQQLKNRNELQTYEISKEEVKKIEESEPGFVWPILVLHHIKGVDFPVRKEELLSRLKGIMIEKKRFEEIFPLLPEEIESPSHLLKLLKEVSK